MRGTVCLAICIGGGQPLKDVMVVFAVGGRYIRKVI